MDLDPPQNLPPPQVEWPEGVKQPKRWTPDMAKRYGDPVLRSHYTRVAERLRHYDDAVLLQAGFWHGLSAQDIRARWHGRSLVRRTLEDFQKLIHFKTRGISQADAAEFLALPWIRAPRALILFLADQFEKLDPDAHLARWSETFPTEPRALPQALVESTISHGRHAAELQFICNLLARISYDRGLWFERNLAENLALYHSSRASFNRALSYVLEQVARGVVNKILRFMRRWMAQRLRCQIDIRWQWRHLASIAARSHLRPGILNDAASLRHLYLAGFVTFQCKSAGTCYQALQILHEHFPHQPAQLRDYARGVAVSGYRAIHTVLQVKIGKEAVLVAIKILPSARDLPVKPSGRTQLKAMLKMVEPLMRVYTRDGEAKDLRIGATVLEFAYALRPDFVARVEYATLNEGRRVEPNHRLAPADQVDLVLLPKPRDLQERWYNDMLPSTRLKMKAAVQKSLAVEIEASARAWVGKHLKQRGVDHVEDIEAIDYIIEEAADEFAKSREQSGEVTRSAWEWFMFIGEHSAKPVQPHELEEFMPLVERHAKRLSSCTLVEAEPPGDSVSVVRPCGVCKPEGLQSDAPIPHTRQNGEIVYHDQRCSELASADVTWIKPRARAISRTFFIIETTNAKGVGADILSVFRQARIDINEFVGRRLGRSAGVIRVEAEFISVPTARKIVDRVFRLKHVRRVETRPAGEYVHDLEGHLPARRSNRTPWLVPGPEPYYRGDVIKDDRYFYGRESQMNRLRYITAVGGDVLFVKGPYKVGKTSLIHYLIRELEVQKDVVYVCVYVDLRTVRGSRRWANVEASLHKKLQSALKRVATEHSLPPPTVTRGNIVNTLKSVLLAWPTARVVLCVDEVIGYLKDAATPKDVGGMASLSAFVRETARATLVWIGPEAQVRHLEPKYQQIVGSCEQLHVGNFSDENHTRSLIAATKWIPQHNISVGPEIVTKIHQLTGGYPLWIQHLGADMFECSRGQEKQRVRAIRYTEDALESARGKLLADPSRFTQITGLAPDNPNAKKSGNEITELRRAILQILASAEANGFVGKRYLYDQLSVSNRERCAEVLTELEQAGAVTSDFSTSASAITRYRLACPLLADHIRSWES